MAVTDLPQPDSPTRPSTSPRGDVQRHVIHGRATVPSSVSNDDRLQIFEQCFDAFSIHGYCLLHLL